ncbi:hypothetical protein DENSPDRAFT_791159 [Dentipellis sp. KUC8613]|nr:hypothetical protein DENSPDRAFT_791159 [Dentipellis sp. KUC8613]
MSSSSESSAASSSSSSSRSSSSPAPEASRKRKRTSAKQADASDSDTSSSSDSESEAEPEDSKEPVLSHAAKRKQKKKLQKLQDEPEDGKATKNSRKPAEGAQPKRQNSVWVGNLPFKATPESIRRFFDGVGEITRVHMPTKTGPPINGAPGRKENRGFAYVDFSSPDAKIIAISMSERPMEGRRLLIKDGDDFTGRPTAPAAAEGEGGESKASAPGTGLTKTAQKILSSQKQPPAPTLFFGNLGFETTEKSLKELLEAHRYPRGQKPDEENGEKEKDVWIRKVRLGTFEDSGLCKGFAFVDFTKIEHATAALTNPKNHHMDGRKLVVEYASADAVRRGGGPNAKPRTPAGGKPGPRKSIQREHDETSGQAEEKKAVEAPRGQPRVGRDHGRQGKTRPRSTPGAALALAKREQVAIVPSQGKRITFDE